MFVRRQTVRQRGFTLTELMVVVALVGTLAIIGVASFRQQLAASKSSEAAAVIQAIRGAQEAYRAENQRYLSVSDAENAWYPVATFDGSRHHWVPKSHKNLAAWSRLGANVTQPVLFRYLVHAGGPGEAWPTFPTGAPKLDTPSEPWYAIQARADADEDGTYCNVIATSLNGELFIQNEGE